jgi:hypothetical protein
MRRGVTVLLVVVVAAIALAAGFDALRDDDSPQVGNESEPEASSVSTTEPDGPTNYVPLESGLGGTLYYTDEGCQLQAVELPGVEPAEAPNWNECNFVLSPTGRRVSGAGSGWDPRADPQIGRLFQSENGTIQVSTNRGPEDAPFRGTAPAWRPDGTLTYFADGAVREWPGGRVVIPERQLLAAAMTHINAPADASVIRGLEARQAAWLDQERAVVTLHAAVRSGSDLDLAAVFQRGRRPDGVSTLAPISELWTSPGGQFWAMEAGGLQVFQGDGDTLPLPPLVEPVAVTWSPDETHMAVATRASVLVFPSGETSPVRRLPLDAQDLDWRGEAGLAVSQGTRVWIGRQALSGRLFVTQAEASGCTLRALQLPDLGWAQQPPGSPNPCRFSLGSGDAVVTENTVPRPVGGDTAACHEGVLDWFSDSGLVTRYRGACAPAWMPDSRLTFLRDGSLYLAWPNGDSRRLVSRTKVSQLLGRPSALEEIAWADDERFWAVVRSEDSAIVALLTTDRLVSSPSFTTRTIEGLRVSSTGMVAARTDQGVVFFDTGGQRAMTFPDGQAVAWAPGELIAAVATTNEIQFVAPLSREVVSVPLAVRDLEWVVP